MPEVKHAMRSCAQKTRTVNYISLALHERTKQQRIIRRIVFQVRILDYHEVSSCLLNSAAQCRAFAHVSRLHKYPDLRILRMQPGENFLGTVLRSVIDTNHFQLEWHGQYALDYEAQRGALVVNRYDDRQFHAGKVSLV